MDGPIPIIIGVTGHRDLIADQVDHLKKAIRGIFADLQTQYPATPLLVLSPLAEGADRLVAKVALEFEADLAVPLPVPAADYEKDFEAPQSRKEFELLLAKAKHCLVMPLARGNTPESIRDHGDGRNRQYALAGAYLVRHSQLLITLWDGVDTQSEGGTWQIVRFKLEGIPEPYAPAPNPLDLADNGPVYHIQTPRLKNPELAGTAFELKERFPGESESPGEIERFRTRRDVESGQGSGATQGGSTVAVGICEKKSKALREAHLRILARMNTFNGDVKKLARGRKAEIRKNREHVIPEAEISRLTETERFILDQYALADTLALHFQKRRRYTLIALSSLIVLAFLGFEAYAHLLNSPWILAIYPVALAAAVGLYCWAKKRDYQNKHLDYRAFAEGLRVQLFWELSGVEEEVADHYLRQHRTELEWIRNAIRSTNILAKQCCNPQAGAAGPPVNDVLESTGELVLTRWVENQRNFFEGARTRDRRKLDRHEGVAQWLFFLGLGLATLVTISHFIISEHNSLWRGHHWLIVVMGTLPAIAAAMAGYAEKMVFSAQAKRYQWMAALFSRASERLRRFLNERKLKEARQLIFELGKEALEENGDWVMLHREREVDVRKGG